MIGPGALVPPMTEAERRKFSDYIEGEFGIKMPASKKSLLEGRLFRRLPVCGVKTYGDYLEFVTRDPRGRDEFLRFADLVSTHETSFFREPGHFEFLKRKWLPARAGDQAGALEVLSAACSTGEEAYTLAMVVDAFSPDLGESGASFVVEGVDLSDRAVTQARRGVYLEEKTQSIPGELKTRYWMRSKDPKNRLARVVPELRRRTSFHRGNLLGDLALERRAYDLIFCRNVLIYFDRPNQRRVISTLLRHLKPEGLLFLGHSETMLGLDLSLNTVAHAIYKKT